MARLRHIAVVVKDLDKAAKFYSEVFEFKKIAREDLDIGSAIYMSDGVINMALLNFKGKGGTAASDLKEGSTFVGAHHASRSTTASRRRSASRRPAASSSSTSATNAPATSSASSRIRTA